MWLFDQSAAEVLATGQQRRRFVSLSPDAQNLPLRVTLVWTDPPGNPVAGLKLVNDLDLVVTNLDTGAIFFGNDIPAGSSFSSPAQPGSSTRADVVNNVENVFLAPALGRNYSVTVVGRRVAVNAATEHPDDVVQDYALVIASGDGQLTNALTITEAPAVVIPSVVLTVITNSFAAGSTEAGGVLLGQRAGTSAPLLSTNYFYLPGLSNEVFSTGTLSQWHFYVFTNDTSFTNAVFLTFLPEPLSLIPTGPDSPATLSQLWSGSADLDLYVSHDSGLTNLDPAALAAADVSLGRGGNETILYSNALPGVYYVGVKCESSKAAEYGLVADFSEEPFVQSDAVGNEILRGFPSRVTITKGPANAPGNAYSFYVTPDTFPVRRVIVTNTFSYASFSDLQATLAHGSASVTLNNHSTNGASTGQTFVYDDSGEGDVPGAVSTDGPGSLRDFSGQDSHGQWLLAMSTTNQPGTNESSRLFLERQQDLGGVVMAGIQPGVCREDFLVVPLQASNLTANITIASGAGPISFQVFPLETSVSNCSTLIVNGATPSGTVAIDQTSCPPLAPGQYVVRTCNLGADLAGVTIQASSLLDQAPFLPAIFASRTPLVISDDAVCGSSLTVTNSGRVVAAEVGVRIDHPRISDLTLSLISPTGAHVVLVDNRGGAADGGLGANLVVTNSSPVDFEGGSEAVTNVFDTGQTSGNILVNYSFFSRPDEMRIYYETNLLYDSGLVSFDGSTNIHYGPGSSTSFTIVMNQGGNPDLNTAWHYTVTSTRIEPLYLTFTENTNLTTTPFKFAPAPFTNLTVAPPEFVTGIFYLPEESLNRFVGAAAAGQWQLEIVDNRAGATNPTPKLLAWQLSLWLASTEPTPISLTHGVSVTNLIGPGQIQWYQIEVPNWVNFATNVLLGTTAPINLLFNSLSPPTGTNAGDLVLGSGATSGTWVLRTNSTPGLVPGEKYYLGIENTNTATVTSSFGVGFDVGSVVSLAAGVSYANTNSGPLNSADFYRFVVSTNAVRVQFEVNGPTSDVTLLARKGVPLPSLSNFDFLSTNPGTNDELIVVYDYSRPVSLAAGEWFLAVVNVTGSPASYSVLATEFSAYATDIIVTDPLVVGNGLCITWNSLPGIHYFLEGKVNIDDSAWTSVTPTLTAADLTTTFCVPLPTPLEYFRVSEGLVLVPALPTISLVSQTGSGTILEWSAPTNVAFNVQWAPALVPATWTSFSGSVTSTTGIFQFQDDGTQTGGIDRQRFYRLRQLP
jgi:subtilisin-like proprotein convertase family protein